MTPYFSAILSRSIKPLSLFAIIGSLCFGWPAAHGQSILQAVTAVQPENIPGQGGPTRLRQPTQAGTPSLQDTQFPQVQFPQLPPVPPAPYKPSEFEAYVQSVVGPPGPNQSEIRRFGSDLLTGSAAALSAPDYSPVVPPDYLLQAGDELVLTLWGSVDADLRLQVDRSGRINVPRVGPIMVSGVRYSDLPDVISRRVAQVFKNFQLSVSLGQLRGLRVYVTGFVTRPGVQVVSSLSTMAQTLMRAGGPSSAGSFRNVQLRRGRNLVATFDLYDLLIKGDREADRLVQAEDVILVGPIGPQVAMIGSVNRPAIFELKPGETVADALTMAGGFAAVADTTRLAIERLDERATLRVKQINLPAAGTEALHSGDLVRAFNAISVLLPAQKQNKRVRIEGEVVSPGEYVMPPGSSLADALQRAGGLTSAAYLYGTDFTRDSVRITQQQNFERALRDMETDMSKAALTSRTTTADEVAGQASALQGTTRLIERLRLTKPTGRVVLQLPTEGGQLPELALEDGDRLYVPSRPTTVGVFGSVFNTGSYLFSSGRGIKEYLRLAGGPTRGADERSVFVVRANGSVVSSLESGSWLNKSGSLSSLPAEPGDTIFVPEEMNKSTITQTARDWTQIFFQLAVGLSATKTAAGF